LEKTEASWGTVVVGGRFETKTPVFLGPVEWGAWRGGRAVAAPGAAEEAVALEVVVVVVVDADGPAEAAARVEALEV
jgi:hypothetical protein